MKFRCCSCNHTFDQSEQEYQGIAVIGKKVVCPNCKLNLKVSEMSDLDKKFNTIGLLACALFFILLIYNSYVENPTKFTIILNFIPVILIMILKVRDILQKRIKIKKGEYYTLKTEQYEKI